MAYNNISKTREGARVLSKEADYLQYDTYGKLPLIGGKRSIGEPNIDQTKRGVLYGNVQSAIDDLYTLIEQIPINGVVTMTEDAPPIAVQQVESVSFDGIVDLFTIIPAFFLSGFVIFRMLRVARVFHLFRLNAKYDSFNVITTVLYEKRNQIISSVFIVLILTIGYGDIDPITTLAICASAKRHDFEIE